MRAVELCGSFWTEYYASPVPAACADAGALLLRSISQPGTSGGRVIPWTLSAAQRRSGTDPTTGRPAYGYPVPVALPNPLAVVTAASRSGVLWLAGQDFTIANGRAWFFDDPLVRAEVSAKTFTNGQVVLWALEAAPNSPILVTKPGTAFDLAVAISTACDVPVFRQAGTVEVSEAVGDGWCVATENEAFALPNTTNPVVSVGDTALPGDPVCDAWQLLRVGPDVPASIGAGAGIAIGPYGLIADVSSPIIFPNEEGPLYVDTVDGVTRARFILAGDADDVDAFWAAGHAAAVAGAVSLAQMLDTRSTPYGQPTAYDLPESVNPAEVLCRKLVGGCGYVLIVKPAAFGPNAVSTSARQSAVRRAATPNAGIWEYENEMPTADNVVPI